MGYCTVIELRAAMNMTDTEQDGLLSSIIDAVSDHIDTFCNRPDGFVAMSTASARLFVGSGTEWQRIDECISVTQVRVRPAATSDYETWTSSDFGIHRNQNAHHRFFQDSKLGLALGDFCHLDHSCPKLLVRCKG